MELGRFFGVPVSSPVGRNVRGILFIHRLTKLSVCFNFPDVQPGIGRELRRYDFPVIGKLERAF
eukprot:3184323-Pyramimonas_sp.AAC.1